MLFLDFESYIESIPETQDSNLQVGNKNIE